MDLQSVIIAVTVIGAIIAALSHGLQLFDRLDRWRRARRAIVQGATADSDEPTPAEIGSTKRRIPPRLALAMVLLGIVTIGGVAVWMVRDSSSGNALAPTAAPAPPSGPSLAVMPFADLGGAADSRLIADGLTQNITTAVANIPGLLVVARYSVMQYQGQSPTPAQVGRDQGVRHVLSGSVQRSGDRMRVTAQMTDTSNGQPLWSERYDRQVQDLFDVQDDIALRVAAAVQARLTEGDQARVRQRGTRNLDAWRLATQGFEAFSRYDPASNAEAQRLLEQAVQLDPGYPWAWSALASARSIAVRFGYAADPPAMMSSAEAAARRAIELDPLLAQPHGMLAVLYLVREDFNAAESSARRAVALEPSSSEMHALLAQVLVYRGRWEEGVTMMRRAVRLSPRHPSWYLVYETMGQIFLGQAPAAAATARRMHGIAESPMMRADAQSLLAFALVESGRLGDAQAAMARARNAKPGHALAHYRRIMHFENPANFERLVAAMRRAGLPD